MRGTSVFFLNGLVTEVLCSTAVGLFTYLCPCVLQMYPSLNNMGDIRDLDKVKLDTSLSFGTTRKTTRKMLEKIEQEMEKLTSLGKSSCCS